MNRKILILCLVFLLCLSGCDKGSDAPDDTGPVDTKPGEITNLPVDVSPTPEDVVTPVPLTEEEVKQDYAQTLVSSLQNLVLCLYEYEERPLFYPVDETNMTRLQDMLTAWNEDHPEIVWDPYSIEGVTWGFRATVMTPVDMLGNPQYVWFEVRPDDITSPRLIIASAGDDGILTFKGTGGDYSVGGFGDDDVRFINF